MEVIDIEHAGGVAVVVPRVRRLDAGVASEFRAQVVQQVQAGERRLLVDLGQVEFLDSSGLGALVSILKALGSQGALAVCGAGSSVRSLFKLTRMDRVFTIYEDRHAALAQWGG
jgi:anti-sigma B factor antagonist